MFVLYRGLDLTACKSGGSRNPQRFCKWLDQRGLTYGAKDLVQKTEIKFGISFLIDTHNWSPVTQTFCFKKMKNTH